MARSEEDQTPLHRFDGSRKASVTRDTTGRLAFGTAHAQVLDLDIDGLGVCQIEVDDNRFGALRLVSGEEDR